MSILIGSGLRSRIEFLQAQVQQEVRYEAQQFAFGGPPGTNRRGPVRVGNQRWSWHSLKATRCKVMKFAKLKCITAIAVFTPVALPLQLVGLAGLFNFASRQSCCFRPL